MVVTNKSHELFLSHAAADKQLLESFETLLAKSIGLTSQNIFCSSLEGQGVAKGGNFVDVIRTKASTTGAVVALITPAYLDSPFCMAELGAAWVLNTHRLPIVVPPNTFKVMEATLLGIVGVQINDEDALAQAFEDLARSMEINPPAVGVRARAMREFQRAWDSLKDVVSQPKRIEASVHSEVIRERDQALEARDAAEAELSKAEAKIEALRKVKDTAEVAKIDERFCESNWQEKFDDALEKIRELYPELGGKEIVRLLILDHLGKFAKPDFNNFNDEISRAIELDVYDEDNVKWNYDHPDVKTLFKLIDGITAMIEEDPKIKNHLKFQKKKDNPGLIRFWEDHL